jgi:hypothetical protein
MTCVRRAPLRFTQSLETHGRLPTGALTRTRSRSELVGQPGKEDKVAAAEAAVEAAQAAVDRTRDMFEEVSARVVTEMDHFKREKAGEMQARPRHRAESFLFVVAQTASCVFIELFFSRPPADPSSGRCRHRRSPQTALL